MGRSDGSSLGIDQIMNILPRIPVLDASMVSGSSPRSFPYETLARSETPKRVCKMDDALNLFDRLVF
jgi:hypothetical protein